MKSKKLYEASSPSARRSSGSSPSRTTNKNKTMRFYSATGSRKVKQSSSHPRLWSRSSRAGSRRALNRRCKWLTIQRRTSPCVISKSSSSLCNSVRRKNNLKSLNGSTNQWLKHSTRTTQSPTTRVSLKPASNSSRKSSMRRMMHSLPKSTTLPLRMRSCSRSWAIPSTKADWP